MKLNENKIISFIEKLDSSNWKTIQGIINQMFQYIYKTISKDNIIVSSFKNDNKKWEDYINTPTGWMMPSSEEESMSFSYNIYESIANNGYEMAMNLYTADADESINNMNNDFLEYFGMALEKIDETEKENLEIKMDEQKVDTNKVFVVHGRNEKLRRSMFNFLRSISLNPLEWSDLILDTKKGSPYIGEILDIAFSKAQSVIVLLSPDDEVKLKEEYQNETDDDFEKEVFGQARPNVLFEGGMAMGRNPERTIFVQVGKIRPFSDIVGRHIIKLDNDIGKRQDLANRLKKAGCNINLRGTDWHNTGDFAVV